MTQAEIGIYPRAEMTTKPVTTNGTTSTGVRDATPSTIQPWRVLSSRPLFLVPLYRSIGLSSRNPGHFRLAVTQMRAAGIRRRVGLSFRLSVVSW